MSSEAASITFYDIASASPSRTFAANPWKTRLALNYKGVPYKTRWVQMPDIAAVREKLGVPANRTNADGSPYHTLPVIEDKSTGALIGDTFEIAQYLDSTYPSEEGKNLFRPETIGLVAAHNAHIDGIFTKYALLCSKMPFDPSVAAKVGEMFAKRAAYIGKDMSVSEEQRQAMFIAFEAALGELSKAYRHEGGTTDYFWLPKGTSLAQKQRGRVAKPFLDGQDPVYADLIIGAWLKMFEASMPEEDWAQVRTWHGGLWGRVVDELKPWAEMR
ncbi:hypothetical protein BST61_g1292 [Cercospora zeina]